MKAPLLQVFFLSSIFSALGQQPLPDTEPLTTPGDLASNLVVAADRFLLRQTELAAQNRDRFWKPDFTSPEKYQQSLDTNRARLAHIVGLRDSRAPAAPPHVIAAFNESPLLAENDLVKVTAIRWRAFAEVHGEGLLIEPKTKPAAAWVVAIPDADQTPEQLAALDSSQAGIARQLAEAGCAVIIPTLVDRSFEPRNGRARMTSREFLYRPAFELGRHIIGYELQKIFSAIDGLSQQSKKPVGVIGWGEGGLLALYAAALDPRITVACVSGYFENRTDLWEEPIDRNLFGFNEQFGDAELAALIAPRSLILEAAKGPELTLPSQGGAPGRLRTPHLAEVKAEFQRAEKLIERLKPATKLQLVVSGDGTGPAGTEAALSALLKELDPSLALSKSNSPLRHIRPGPDPKQRQKEQMAQLDRHTQSLLTESPSVREKFMSKLDLSTLEKFQQSAEWYRTHFAEEIIGRFDLPLTTPKPRARFYAESPHWIAYEVQFDVFDELFAYGILVLPKNIPSGEKRPVVVCQHGLEGRPQDVVSGNNPAYHDFAGKLAERGFITFAPQNLYIFQDRFRTLQRKANPLKKTLFSLIVPQHQQIVNWLKTLPQTDPERIAFYGLSYGGKSAMRIPPLVKDYCLSICSADFNEWVWKNASSRSPYSYVWTGEYEIFEFDLGSTFNYAEMAALIAPRPFMVERGHFDGVAPDEAVAYEFAKVRRLYQARLRLGDRCAIEWFVGPHTINGKGTFDFLHTHLRWPKR